MSFDLLNDSEYAVWLACEGLVEIPVERFESDEDLEDEEAAELPAELFDEVLALAIAA